jgi:putative transcriptional regulator
MSIILPKKSDILISEPYLEDEFFYRSVVYLCDHNDEGTYGFILNKKMPYKIHEAISGFPIFDANLYMGGPVETQSLFYVHRIKELKDSIPLSNELYWSGDFNELRDMIELDFIKPSDIKFFLGYSGWSHGQLQDEINEKSWIISPIGQETVLMNNDELLWNEILIKLGGDYSDITNYPKNPHFN